MGGWHRKRARRREPGMTLVLVGVRVHQKHRRQHHPRRLRLQQVPLEQWKRRVHRTRLLQTALPRCSTSHLRRASRWLCTLRATSARPSGRSSTRSSQPGSLYSPLHPPMSVVCSPTLASARQQPPPSPKQSVARRSELREAEPRRVPRGSRLAKLGVSGRRQGAVSGHVRHADVGLSACCSECGK